MLTSSEKISLLYGLYSELRDMDRWKDIVKPERKEKVEDADYDDMDDDDIEDLG